MLHNASRYIQISICLALERPSTKKPKVIIPLETPFITHPRACNCASGLCLTFHLCKVKARSSLNNKCQSSSVESVLLEYWNLGWQVWHSQADLYYLRTANNQDYPALLWLFDLKINYCKFSPLDPTPGSPALHTVFRQKVGKMTKSRLSSLQCTISHWRDSISNIGKVFAAS